jgi:hypothetical protein
VAYEWRGETLPAPRKPAPAAGGAALRVRKPTGQKGH